MKKLTFLFTALLLAVLGGLLSWALLRLKKEEG